MDRIRPSRAECYTYAWSGPGGWTAEVDAPAKTFACTALAGDVTLTVSNSTGASISRTVALAACPSPLDGTAAISAPTYAGNYAAAAYTFTGTATGGSGSLTTSWTGPLPLPNSSLSPMTPRLTHGGGRPVGRGRQGLVPRTGAGADQGDRPNPSAGSTSATLVA